MSSRIRIYTTGEIDSWDILVKSAWQYDFYHLSGYHSLAERRGEGKALLIQYQEGPRWIAIPLLLHCTNNLPGLSGVTICDATSVYGYAGPLVSEPGIPDDVTIGFLKALDSELATRDVCTLFSRLHPLMNQSSILSGYGEVTPIGETVSIDLTQDSEYQQRQYRKGHRYDLKKLRRSGIETIWSNGDLYLEDFANLYLDTMQRLKAGTHYFFNLSYFRQLLALEEVVWRLGICMKEGQLLCGGLFSLTGSIVQYHLSGTSASHIKEAPMKMLIDEARQWANEQGAAIFHLGGGVGSQKDSLFSFKAGFSKHRHSFAVWRWIRDPNRYQELVSKQQTWMDSKGIEVQHADFFPFYRAPLPSEDNL